jgi:antitoxin (DNA-binding transcriptional repressor) of toxin-antitoxin stability system
MAQTVRMGMMEALAQVPSLLNQLRDGTRIVLTHDGRDIAAMLPLRDLQALEGLEALSKKLMERRD